VVDDQPDPARDTSDRYNRENLVALLRESGEPTVELYRVWDGNFDFSTPPLIREDISLESILQPRFRFKEQGFYLVTLTAS
jgi:hypothetical protein